MFKRSSDGVVKNEFFLTYMGADAYEERVSDFNCLKVKLKNHLEQYFKLQVQVRGIQLLKIAIRGLIGNTS